MVPHRGPALTWAGSLTEQSDQPDARAAAATGTSNYRYVNLLLMTKFILAETD